MARLSRVARGITALVALLAGLVGIPAALVVLGGDPVPSALSWPDMERALFSPDDGTILIGLITIVGWLAWLAFAVSVLVELVELASHRRIRIRLPGLSGPQRLVAGLLLSVIAMAGGSQIPSYGHGATPGEVQPGLRTGGSGIDLAEPMASAGGGRTAAVASAGSGGSSTVTSAGSAGSGTDTPAGGGEMDTVASAGRGGMDTVASAGGRDPTDTVASPGSGGTRLVASAGTVAGDPIATGGSTALGRSGHPAATGATALRSVPPADATHGDGAGHVHVVKAGDDLWSLAERYYGQGREWRRIAMANPAVLTGGPDRLQPGWRLRIPGAASGGSDSGRIVVVQKGDTLSSIARDVYGDPSAWQRLWHANRAQLEDPDELVAGIRLVAPASPTSRSTDGRDQRTSADDDRETSSGGSERGGGTDTADKQGTGRSQSTGDEQRAGGEQGTGSEQPTAGAQPTPGTQPRDEGQRTTGTEGQRTSGTDGQRTSGTDGSGASQPTGGRRQTTSSPAATAAASQASDQSGKGTPVDTADQSAPEPYESVVLGLASVGSLLAAGLIAGLAFRRRAQLQARPLGRRIVPLPEPAQRAEAVLGRRQRPLNLRALDLATRAISAHCYGERLPLPPLQTATVDDEWIELVMSEPAADPPPGFTAIGGLWRLDQAGLDRVRAITGISEAGRPYPALVSLGQDQHGRQLLADLESVGLLAVVGEPEISAGVLAAMAIELAFSPSADELILTLVGVADDLPDALGQANVTRTDDLDGLLDRFEQRAAAQRAQPPAPIDGHRRIDPDLSDPWAPEIALIALEPTPDQRRRLARLLTTSPPVTMAAAVAADVPEAPWRLRFHDAAGGRPVVAELQPAGASLRPQLIESGAERAVVQLVAATGSVETVPAPWWYGAAEPPGRPPDEASYPGETVGGWGSAEGEVPMSQVEMAGSAGLPRHPLLQLLGPIELVGAVGVPPQRAGKQCLEYCAWLLQHPRTTPRAMASALAVAEGTRRSNMSRLRTWLGSDPHGDPYLPDAYTGRITLHPAVSSDWQQLQILTAGGVNRSTTAALKAALDLVRGAPLADAAPGQWHWAEELRTDMISVIRDIGAELANRALDDNDIDLARWAAARALTAAPGDELLMAARIRTERQAGNVVDAERLTLQVAAHARALGVDLDPETVVLLQEVMEGQVRARLT